MVSDREEWAVADRTVVVEDYNGIDAAERPDGLWGRYERSAQLWVWSCFHDYGILLS